MKTRIIASAVLLPIFFAILFVFPPIVLTIVISIIAAIAAYELLHATKMNGNKRVLVYTITASVLVPMAVYLSSLTALTDEAVMMAEGSSSVTSINPYSLLTMLTLVFTIFFFLSCLLLIEAVLTFKGFKSIKTASSINPTTGTKSDTDAKTDAAEKQLKYRQVIVSLIAGIVIPWMLSSLISLKTLPAGHLLVLLPIVSTFLTDSGAYFTGVAIGKRKVLPTISPNKTLEGFVGGIIIGAFGLMIYGIILSYATDLTVIYPALLLYGIIGAVVTEFGDLVFSFVKRKCSIKDYGKLIPGHGGALDRFDSMIFNAPTMCLLVMLLPAIY